MRPFTSAGRLQANQSNARGASDKTRSGASPRRALNEPRSWRMIASIFGEACIRYGSVQCTESAEERINLRPSPLEPGSQLATLFNEAGYCVRAFHPPTLADRARCWRNFKWRLRHNTGVLNPVVDPCRCPARTADPPRSEGGAATAHTSSSRGGSPPARS